MVLPLFTYIYVFSILSSDEIEEQLLRLISDQLYIYWKMLSYISIIPLEVTPEL